MRCCGASPSARPATTAPNAFFQEDFDELKAAGYLTLPVPSELGGAGYTLAQIAQEQRRLAYHAPATALGVNMHFYFAGVAADVWRSGDKSTEWLLEAAMNGDVFAAGHSEHGNDLPLLLSTTQAERVDGGYRFTGRKSFGSLTPVWTFLGLHALDTSDPEQPKIVHAFMPRDTDGYRIEDVWDALGMRATQSQDTILEGAFVPDEYIACVVPAGAGGANLFVLSIFAWALLNFGNVYYEAGAARVRPGRGAHEDEDVPGHVAADVVSRGGPARGGGDGDGAGRDRAAPRSDCGRLVERRGPRRRLAVEDRGGQAPRRGGRVPGGGSGAGPGRGVRHLQGR